MANPLKPSSSAKYVLLKADGTYIYLPIGFLPDAFSIIQKTAEYVLK